MKNRHLICIQSLAALAYFLPAATWAQSPIQNWRQAYFGTINNSGNAADTADPDHDGLPNLIEYATGSNPLVKSANPAVITLSGGFMHVTIPKNPAAADALVEVETTTDFSNPSSWTTSGLVTDQNTASQLSVHYSAPWSSSRTRYVRLRVTNLNFTVPSAPYYLALTSPAGATVTATWSAPSNNGSPTIDSYLVEVYSNSTLVTSAYVSPSTLSYTFTGLTAVNYPNGIIGQPYVIYVYAHNSVGYSSYTYNTIVPKTSFLADNVRAIFSKTYAQGTCIGCHSPGIPPNLTPAGLTDYNSAVSVGTLIYQVPANQVSGYHTFGPILATGSTEYAVLARWWADGNYQ